MKNSIGKKVKSAIRYRIDLLKDLLINRLWFFTPAGQKNKSKLGQLKNLYQGKRCFIMGNGPSLLKCDLSLLKDEITIVSNANFLIWEQMGFVPNFLTVEDRLVAEDRADELNKLKNIIKIFPRDLSKFLHLDNNTSYINFLRKNSNLPEFSNDFRNVVYWGGTVSYLNLQLAYFLGCTEIYLIGFDHTYKVPEKIVDYVITSEEDDVNHIHPNYFGKGYRWHDPNVQRMEDSYRVARKFLELNSIKISNATVGGELEVFDRVDFNSLFQTS
jgi:hypothetical protein